MAIRREQLDKMYQEYLSGMRREGRKGAMNEPLTKVEWTAEFQFVSEEVLGERPFYSNTELRRINSMMVKSSRRQLTRSQRNALENGLTTGNWADDLTAEEEAEINQFLEELGFTEAANKREWLNFHGRDFTDKLESIGIANWSIFFNS